jgi:hypothetical protein
VTAALPLIDFDCATWQLLLGRPPKQMPRAHRCG